VYLGAPASPFGLGKVWADATPFFVGQIGGVSVVFHDEERMLPLLPRLFSRPSAIFQTVSEGEFSEVRSHDLV
jgi:hypothetical protein